MTFCEAAFCLRWRSGNCDLTCRPSHMQGDRNRVINRIGRLRETPNFKLGSLASNIVGKTGWLILNAIAKGETDPEQLAARAKGSCS
jgi:transposase